MLRRMLLMTIMIGTSIQVFAQSINGIVIDGMTGKPIINARVISASSLTFTSSTGHFSLNKVSAIDTLRVNHLGYKPYSIRLSERTAFDTMEIVLNPKSITLNDVTILGTRNHKQDSLKYRADFEAVFSHKIPTIKESFMTKSRVPNGRYTPFQNATSTLLSLDVLSAIGLFSRNKTPIAKLQRRVLEEEELRYVDYVFSKAKIQSITPLLGDSLQLFINTYRPTIQIIKKMDDYEILQYIKKSYQDFMSGREEFPALH